MRHRPLRTLLVGLTGFALLAASCGDDEESSDDPTEETEADESDESDDSEAENEAEDTEADAPAELSGDGCQVTVTGEVETSWTAEDGDGSVLYGPWLPGVAGSNMDATDLIINCTTEEAGISFTGNGTFEIPMQPATYVISGEQGALGGGSAEIGAIINLGDAGLYGMAADGNLTFTEFDDDHMAGTFELPVKELFGEGDSEEPTASITGSFIFENQND